jgi:hypothetical protein
MPLLPASLKGCNFLSTLEMVCSEINMGEGISGSYDILSILDRLSFSVRMVCIDYGNTLQIVFTRH